MKNKIFTILTISLFLAVSITASINAQIIKELKDNELPLTNNYSVFGIGICYGIGINGDIKQGKGRNQHLAGFINAELSIRNQDPILFSLIGSIFPYFLKIKDLQTGEIYTKETLPLIIYINNFRGIGYIDDYYLSWGPTRAIFFLYGSADYIS